MQLSLLSAKKQGVISIYLWRTYFYRHLPEDQIKEAPSYIYGKDLVKILRACGNGVARNDDSFETHNWPDKNTFIIGSHRHVVFLLCATKIL